MRLKKGDPEFHTKLKALRNAKGYSLTSLSVAVGINRSTLCRYEMPNQAVTSKRGICLDYVRKLNALLISEEEIIEEMRKEVVKTDNANEIKTRWQPWHPWNVLFRNRV